MTGRRISRIVLIVGAVIVLPWAFFGTLGREIGRAFWYAWNEVRIEFSAFKKEWEGKP